MKASSILILAVATRLRHLSVSFAMKAANSAGAAATGVAPSSFRRCAMSASCTMRRVSCWMRVATSGGIFAGPRMPTQATDSKPGSTSAIAGTSGSAALRSRLATPSARILPAWIGDITAVI